jgi:hypothetical protein
MTRRLLLGFFIIVLSGLVPACRGESVRWQAVKFPATESPATKNNAPDPFSYRTLRIGLTNGQRRVLFSEDQEPVAAPVAGNLTMRFAARAPFKSVGLLAAAWGDPDTKPLVRLRNAAGVPIREREYPGITDRTWIDLDVGEQPPGDYRLEMVTNGAGRVGWWGQKVDTKYNESMPEHVRFASGAAPEFSGSSVDIPAGFTADRLAILGGLSTYDHGVGPWQDYEVQSDESDRQFIGDTAGTIEIAYASGTTDKIPLMFGWTIWWKNHFDSDKYNGPFPSPFVEGPAASARSNLRLKPSSAGNAAPYFWEIQTRGEMIKSIRLTDNPDKQGFPLILGISAASKDKTGTLIALPESQLDEEDTKAVRPDDIVAERWRIETEPLRRSLYRAQTDIPQSPAMPEPILPDVAIAGNPASSLMTGIWRANLGDMHAKFGADGKFHTSTPGAPYYGGNQGIGTWRTGVGINANKVRTADLGRAALEVLRLDDPNRVEPAIQFANEKLNDLPNGFPKINRAGQKVPAHWTPVLGDTATDYDHAGDGNQENDSAALMLLAYYRDWRVRGNDAAWLTKNISTVRDAASWFQEQLATPERWRSKDGLLYSEGDSANDGGYDVYSNTLVWRSLIGAAEMVEAAGDKTKGSELRAASNTIRAAVNRQLVESTQSGQAWTAVSTVWGYGNESLAPILSAADVSDYDLASLTDAEKALAEATYRRQLQKCPKMTCVRTVGFGQAFLAQSALLMDDLTSAGPLLDRLGTVIYDARQSPYLVPEGVVVGPNGQFWYRTGDLGNAGQQAEVMKALSLVVGVEQGNDGRFRLLPRLPDGWNSVNVTAWPVSGGSADIVVERNDGLVHFDITIPRSAPVRFGPVPDKATVFVDGAAARPRMVDSGGLHWAWIDNLPQGHHVIESRR